jgi:triosephosphate isomerase
MNAGQKWAVANWKMNLPDNLEAYAQGLARLPHGARIAICPPATAMADMARALSSTPVLVGAQDCHEADRGAHTSAISAPLAARAGATLSLLGHSERRQGFGESDALVARKVGAVQRHGLAAVVCVGEVLDIREGGAAADHTAAQLRASLPDDANPEALLVAYEPIWAIGTGRAALPDEVGEMHAVIRAVLADRFGSAGRSVPILHGGSVTPANIGEIAAIDEVSGCLVGGASLDIASFGHIVTALR